MGGDLNSEHRHETNEHSYEEGPQVREQDSDGVAARHSHLERISERQPPA